jgi:hypothetical protein
MTTESGLRVKGVKRGKGKAVQKGRGAQQARGGGAPVEIKRVGCNNFAVEKRYLLRARAQSDVGVGRKEERRAAGDEGGHDDACDDSWRVTDEGDARSSSLFGIIYSLIVA